MAYYLGIMSGTSLDGIDIALSDIEPSQLPTLQASHYAPYPAPLRRRLLALHPAGRNELHRAATLGNELALLYSQAVCALLKKTNISPASIQAIGCHGQTVRHKPHAGYTLQLNNPALLAELTNITVIADFRSRDIAAGGQGAPLVPAFHDAVFRHPNLSRVIVNIGGIANLTHLQKERPTHGFDCGPGNILLDAWTQKHLHQAYDHAGKWAESGSVIPALFEQLHAHAFFAQAAPKSCGREEFNLAWVEKNLAALQQVQDANDVAATLLELTAVSITNAITQWCACPDEVLVCGGGAHNDALMKKLVTKMPHALVTTTTARCKIDADWVEALAFAWFAYLSLNNKPGNLPAVTGARGHRILGAIYPK